jgi:hypothetical protein
MSKQEEVAVERPVVTNPLDYGYAPDAQITIPAGLFMAYMQLAGAIAQEETKELILLNQFPLETGPEREANGMPKMQPEQVMMYVSPKGKRAEELFNATIEIHMTMIDSKVAIHRDQAQAEADANAPDLTL